ncbi:TPA: hypothetical protein N0F65_004527 [Lagenidium giganteum]|uniref:Ubiquitin carboxyl-terminal hydrolase n=1 Tax=Lagenidium giganteum TaxID=4803 RepID=A0AAV2YXY9_9STRA|nr:TPA: hypothetical protein N0F65_004527 [Lagenidium giganteum]
MATTTTLPTVTAAGKRARRRRENSSSRDSDSARSLWLLSLGEWMRRLARGMLQRVWGRHRLQPLELVPEAKKTASGASSRSADARMTPAQCVKARGIANSGNTCFVAAVVQCVAALTGFRQALEQELAQIGKKMQKEVDLKRLKVVEEFVALLLRQSAGESRQRSGKVDDNSDEGMACSVRPFTRALSRCTDLIDASSELQEQQDAEEFLSFLLDMLNDVLRREVDGVAELDHSISTTERRLLKLLAKANGRDVSSYTGLVEKEKLSVTQSVFVRDEANPALYELVAVCAHVGASIDSGHYVANGEEEGARGGNKGHGQPVPSLIVMCLKVISDRFCTDPKILNVPRKFFPDIMARLPLDLDVCITAPNVSDENYWKRCCLSKSAWKNLQIADHGLTWKQLYLEKHMQDLLEGFDANNDDHDHLIDSVKACQDFIFTLEIDQLLSHIDLNEICSHLKNLTRLRLTYGVKQIGMKYERMLFGMKISDATNLSHIVKNTRTLTTLWLPSNLLDDDLLRMVMTGLIKNNTITSLDLSHNKITNHGARLIAKLLGPDSVLTSLNLCDNQIHAEGGRYLSRGLKYNTSLVELNLRLNRLTDEGARMLLEGLVEHKSLMNLNLSNNMLGRDTADALAEIIADPSCPLRSIDVSGNQLKETDAQALLQGLQQNSTIVALDLRQNDISAEAECLLHIAQKIRANEVEVKNMQ